MNLGKAEYEGLNWIQIPRDRAHWLSSVYAATNIRVKKLMEYFEQLNNCKHFKNILIQLLMKNRTDLHVSVPR